MAALLPYVTGYSENAAGEETFAHGDPDAINTTATVASITKVMTLWLAARHVGSPDDVVQVDEADIRGSAGRILPGDLVSFRDLFYLAAMPSDNTAPRTIARTVGQLLLDDEGGTGDPAERFHQEMQDEADRLGYVGAQFTNPQFGAWMSARQVVDLFRRAMTVQVLREAFGTLEYTVSLAGPDPREVEIVHSIQTNSPYPLPGFAGGKTGTNYGYGHVVVAWEHPDGSEHVTVILNAHSSDRAERYVELRKVMDATSGMDVDVVGGLTVPFSINAVHNSGHVQVVNAGNASTPAVLRIDGPVQYPEVRHVESRASLTFDLILDAGQWLEVDLDARTVLLNGQASRRGLMRGRWFDLAPGINTISFHAVSQDPGARLTALWRDAYR